MKKTLLLGALVLTLNGCAWMGGGEEAAKSTGDAAAATAAIEAAEAAIKKSASVESEWVNAHGKFLKAAKEAAGKADYAEAIKQAKKALSEGEMGYQQGVEQANAKPWLF